MCREVLDIEPYQFKLRSPERGKAWETISSHLNATSHPKFRVTPRSVRDRYNLLTKKFQVRLNREERASGISDDNSELDNLLEEILEKEKAAKEKLDNDDEDKKKSLANEKAAAEDMRKRALERVGQTAKRKGKEEGPEAEKSKSRKSRKSTGEAMEYLKERASKEIQLREQELEMRKKEQDSISQREREKNEQQDKMLSTMLKQQEQQQQMMMMLLNQQQQQSQALLSLMGKIVPK